MALEDGTTMTPDNFRNQRHGDSLKEGYGGENGMVEASERAGAAARSLSFAGVGPMGCAHRDTGLAGDWGGILHEQQRAPLLSRYSAPRMLRTRPYPQRGV